VLLLFCEDTVILQLAQNNTNRTPHPMAVATQGIKTLPHRHRKKTKRSKPPKTTPQELELMRREALWDRIRRKYGLPDRSFDRNLGHPHAG
jgi:hypothetical protein